MQNTYSVGTKLFCDFHCGGKPKAKCIAVVESGNGKDKAGKVRVRLTETIGAYKKGEEIEISTFYAVPLKQVLPREKGQYFTRVSTLYAWEG